MSYPQALASREIIDGSDFFRLLTPLQSGGDAYEIDVSAQGFALGPNSDLSAVRLTYFDPSQPARVNSIVVGLDTPFVGRIDSLASEKFPIANTQAKIIVTPEDLWNNNWALTAAAENVNYIKPKIDLLCYFAQPSFLPVKRADFVERGRVQIDPVSTYYAAVVPFYRRRYAEIRLMNGDTAGTAGLTIDVIGINFTTDGLSPYGLGDFVAMETFITTAGVISAGAGSVTRFEVDTSANGIFDYLAFRINGAPIDANAANPVRYIIRTTDQDIT
jgi:hypothetical protein